MRWTMAERRVLVRGLAGRYRRSSKKEKGRMLDELVELTGYQRSYAAWLLNRQGRLKQSKHKAARSDSGRKRPRRRRGRHYGADVQRELTRLWKLLDYLCGKRLVAALPAVVEALERHGEAKYSQDVRSKLLSISAATADRLLAGEKKKLQLRGRSRTKPGSLLRQQIAIRTFADWDEAKPGFVEVDLVAHDGGHARGDYAQTLDVTDVATGWTELVAVRNKAQVWTFEALLEARQRLPFPLLGLDSDNGSEFINHHLRRYSKEHKITFTRSRPYRKNDNCFVEQKNYSLVRRHVGYARYDTPTQLQLLNAIYAQLRLHVNFFLPSQKLEHKSRRGSRVYKRYDRARTPYQRVLESADVSEVCKKELQAQYRKLNPAVLARNIRRLEDRLWRQVIQKGRRAVDGAASDGKVSDFPTAAWNPPATGPTPPTATTV